jgi:AP-3 complex subunit mu
LFFFYKKQLLDEIIDFGYPLTTEQGMLSDLVKPPPGESLHVSKPVQSFGQEKNLNIEWRKPGIHYTQNQLHLDVVEEISSTIDV